MTILTAHCKKADTGYFGHLKIGSHMVFWSLAVFITSTIHAIFPFVLEASSMNAAKKLASLVDTTFEHHK
jgi:hypothetical protein